MAITSQPGVYPSIGEDGMKMTQSYAGGLDQLNSLDRILVQQKMELCEVITGWEQKNKYQICNSNGEEIFFMREENSCCTRQCCGPNRPFNFHVTDPAGLEVLHFKRDCVCAPCGWPNCFCCLCPFPCSDQELTVNSMGSEIGRVRLESTCGTPTLTVRDSGDQVLFTLISTFCQCSFGGEIEYKIISAGGEEIGTIVKEYNGCCKESFTDADNYVINFPVGISMYHKALLLSATLSIDFLFYETKSNDN